MNVVFIYDGQSNMFAQLAANYRSLQPVYNSYQSKKHFYLFTFTKLYDSVDLSDTNGGFPPLVLS